MRKLILVVMAVCLMASTAFAATEDIGQGMVDKAVNGAVNLVTGIVEVPVQIYKGYSKGLDFIKDRPLSKGVGAVLGLFRGIGHAAGRMSWGAMELVGFWSANPRDNAGVGLPLDAKYAWETGEQYSIFKPSLKEGIKPIHRKLGHGLANTFVGIAEVPSQIQLSRAEGKTLRGVGRGIWFWLSREVYGIGSIVTCIVPNPADNPGYPFNQKWPWSAISEKVK